MLKKGILFVCLVAVTTSTAIKFKKRGVDDADGKKVNKQVENMDKEKVLDTSKQFNNLSSEDFLTREELLSMKTEDLPEGILLPKGPRGVPRACIDAPFGESPGMSEIKKDSRNELYMCAFVNFQYHIGDSKRSARYTKKTVGRRFALFKKCVDDVNDLNKKHKAGLQSWFAGVTFFCDMTKKEKSVYHV